MLRQTYGLRDERFMNASSPSNFTVSIIQDSHFSDEPKITQIGSQSAIPRVAVLVDTSTTWGQCVIASIQDYNRLHVDWQIFVEQLKVARAWAMKEHFSKFREYQEEGWARRFFKG